MPDEKSEDEDPDFYFDQSRRMAEANEPLPPRVVLGAIIGAGLVIAVPIAVSMAGGSVLAWGWPWLLFLLLLVPIFVFPIVMMGALLMGALASFVGSGVASLKRDSSKDKKP